MLRGGELEALVGPMESQETNNPANQDKLQPRLEILNCFQLWVIANNEIFNIKQDKEDNIHESGAQQIRRTNQHFQKLYY